IPTPTLPLKGRETTDAPCSSPVKGEAGRGMGNVFHANHCWCRCGYHGQCSRRECCMWRILSIDHGYG
ncbi:MAG: hypothetical protein Q8O31_07320, partial [Rhodocyclaceae bacterium]|nr:hypothetical protein [Rhodocyclaceae bacterium]